MMYRLKYHYFSTSIIFIAMTFILLLCCFRINSYAAAAGTWRLTNPNQSIIETGDNLVYELAVSGRTRSGTVVFRTIGWVIYPKFPIEGSNIAIDGNKQALESANVSSETTIAKNTSETGTGTSLHDQYDNSKDVISGFDAPAYEFPFLVRRTNGSVSEINSFQKNTLDSSLGKKPARSHYDVIYRLSERDVNTNQTVQFGDKVVGSWEAQLKAYCDLLDSQKDEKTKKKLLTWYYGVTRFGDYQVSFEVNAIQTKLQYKNVPPDDRIKKWFGSWGEGNGGEFFKSPFIEGSVHSWLDNKTTDMYGKLTNFYAGKGISFNTQKFNALTVNDNSWRTGDGGIHAGYFHMIYERRNPNVTVPTQTAGNTPKPDDPNDPGNTPTTPTTPTIPGTSVNYNAGKSEPDIATFHKSDVYNVGEGIPSSESLKNTVLANRWYGTYNYQYFKTGDINGTITYKIKVKYISGYTTHTHHDPVTGATSTTKTPNYTTTTMSVTVTTTRKADAWIITDIDMNNLSSITVSNNAYGKAVYGGSVVSANLKSNGKDNVTNVQGFDFNEHFRFFPNGQNQTYSVTLDSGTWNSKPSEDDLKKHKFSELGNKTPQEDADESPLLPVYARNDALTIDGHEYLKESNSSVMDKSSVQWNGWDESHSSFKEPQVPKITKPVNGGLVEGDMNAGGGDYGQFISSRTKEIPASTRNGKYSTELKAVYTNFLGAGYGTTVEFVKEKDDAIFRKPNSTMYLPNEPIYVHTPVITPVKITDPDKKSDLQLVHLDIPNEGTDSENNRRPAYKLQLDGTYTMKFQPLQWWQDYSGDARHGERDSAYEMKGYENGIYDKDNNGSNPDSDDTADRYDKYVREKQVRFPFPVYITDMNAETYYPLKGNYTQWITVQDNTFKFYIPTWAEENTTHFKRAASSTLSDTEREKDLYDIQFRVNAINASALTENGTPDEEQDTLNSESEHYTATYHLFANVSGHIYDFEVLGTNDKDMFSGYSDDVSEDTKYPFAVNMEEKKTGTLNRFGNKYVRYTDHGLITDSWDKSDTIPLRLGSSHQYSEMGNLWKGTTFAFSVKTIANLSDDDDYLRITPTLRYYDKNGNKYVQDDADPEKDLIVYYSDDNGKYVRVGSKDDTVDRYTVSHVHSVTLSDKMFDGGWYEGSKFHTDVIKKSVIDATGTILKGYLDKQAAKDVLKDTAGYMGKNKKQITGNVVPSYTMSDIILTKDLRLFTGDSEQLERNQDKLSTQTGAFQDKFLTDAGEEVFKKSMQTWYGEYTFPEKIYVTTQEKLNKRYKDLTGITKTDATLTDIAKVNGISEDDKVFMQGGYMVVNFQIETFNGKDNSGKPIEHLEYSGSGENMWSKQGQPETSIKEPVPTYDPDDPDPDPSESEKKNRLHNITINTKYGDVAIIDMSHKLSDKYEGRIFMIN